VGNQQSIVEGRRLSGRHILLVFQGINQRCRIIRQEFPTRDGGLP